MSHSTNSSDEKPRSCPPNRLCRKEEFDETLDVMESRNPLANLRIVNLRIVITTIITEPPKNKRKIKTPRTPFEFTIMDATELSS